MHLDYMTLIPKFRNLHNLEPPLPSSLFLPLYFFYALLPLLSLSFRFFRYLASLIRVW